MRLTTASGFLVTFLAFTAAPLVAQGTRFPNVAVSSAPVSQVPVRELTSPAATSSEHFGTILGVRALAGGKLLVDDARHHQLLMLDSAMHRIMVIIDSAGSGLQSYPTGTAPIIPFLGDSTLFVDGSAVSLVVIAPNGTIARTMAPPRASDMLYLSGRGVAMDAGGNLVYRMDETPPSRASQDTALLRRAYSAPESTLVVRASFASGRLDTIGRIKFPSQTRTKLAVVGGRALLTLFEDPLPSQDESAVLSDGTIMFVRSHDYHVDIVRPDGARIAGPKLPFEWKRLTDADKQALLDSALAQEVRDKEAIKAMIANRPPPPGAAVVSAKATNGMADRASSAPPSSMDVVREYKWLTPDQIADYYPPIRAGAVKADMQAQLWILPTTSAQSKNGELVYDVVNNRGELAERVRVPAGRSIAGFGKAGEVYLMSRDANGWVLERSRVQMP